MEEVSKKQEKMDKINKIIEKSESRLSRLADELNTRKTEIEKLKEESKQLQIELQA